MPREKPLIFISHKHADKNVASIIGNWIDDLTAGNVDVFLSSDSEFDTPEIGQDLSKDLGKNLLKAGVVILVYTSADHDWSYCTWECGVALTPGTPDTRIMCIQCQNDIPNILANDVRVVVSDEESVISFAKMFKDKNFIPNHDKKITGLSEKKIIDRGKELQSDLIKALPGEPVENWSGWPYLRLEISNSKISNAAKFDSEKSVEAIYQSLQNDAVITDSSTSAPTLFGKEDITLNSRFNDLVENWRKIQDAASDFWIYTLAQQILDSSNKNIPNLKEWARFRPASGVSEYIVGIGRVKRMSTSTSFDCYFYRLVDVPEVKTRMTTLANMYYKDIDSLQLKISDVINEMIVLKRTRLPIVDNGIIKYIIHGSMIDKFICEISLSGNSVSDLTMVHLIEHPDMRELFESSLVCVQDCETVDSVIEKMNQQKNCQDVFITEDGKRESNLLGWVTDRDLIDN